MSQRYFEDLKAGDRFKSGTYKVTEEQIVSFAREFDPQPFHLDPAVARQTMFKSLIASGWHTAAIFAREAADIRRLPPLRGAAIAPPPPAPPTKPLSRLSKASI